jgi:LysR family transcriptional regulator, flagellar master operon regulator
MNIEALRSFLDVAESGSFSMAGSKIGVMQSTISNRIQSLEDALGRTLLTRSKSGAELTAAGRDFRPYAEQIVQRWDQARYQVSLPEGYSGVFRLGGPLSLQDHLSVGWVRWMKEQAPHIALHIEAGRSKVLTEELLAGSIDAAIMYLPRYTSGIVINELANEKLYLVSHPDLEEDWRTNFVLVELGAEFRANYIAAFAQLPVPTVTVGLGALGLQYVLALKASAYLPESLVAGPLAEGRLKVVEGAPVFQRPIYVVHPSKARDPQTLQLALKGLHILAGFTET